MLCPFIGRLKPLLAVVRTWPGGLARHIATRANRKDLRHQIMLGNLASFIVAEGHASAAGEAASALPAQFLAPSIVLILCVFAGLGTLLLLPARRDISIRRIGGGMLGAAALIFCSLVLRSEAGVGIYFWIFSAIALAGAVRVITHPRPVYSALYFVLTVFASAGMFVLLDAEFMAAALVLIYAGAILITYVFVIMLASQARAPSSTASFLSEYDTVSREPMIASMVGFALMGLLIFVIFNRAAPHRARVAADTVSSADAAGPENRRRHAETRRLSLSESDDPTRTGRHDPDRQHGGRDRHRPQARGLSRSPNRSPATSPLARRRPSTITRSVFRSTAPTIPDRKRFRRLNNVARAACPCLNCNF